MALTQVQVGVGGNSNAPAFSAYNSVSQTISTSAYVKVTFDTEEFDTNNNFASSRFTPTVAGYYQLNGTVGSASGNLYPVFYKNGTTIFVSGSINSPASGIGCGAVVSSVVYLNGSTDYIELYCFATTSGVLYGGVSGVRFNGFLARGA
jgi:hypothetical protein